MPIPELIERINAIWYRKGIKPKQHLSEPCPGAETVMEKRKHADRCQVLPPELPDDMDLMIEVRAHSIVSHYAALRCERFYFLLSLNHKLTRCADRQRTRNRRCCTSIECTACTRSSTRFCVRRNRPSRFRA